MQVIAIPQSASYAVSLCCMLLAILLDMQLGSRRFQRVKKVQERSRRLKRVKKVQKDSRRFQKVQAGSRRFKEGSRIKGGRMY